MGDPVVIVAGEWKSSGGCWDFVPVEECYSQSILIPSSMTYVGLVQQIEEEFGVGRGGKTNLSYWVPPMGGGLITPSRTLPVSVRSDLGLNSFLRMVELNPGLNLFVDFCGDSGIDLNREPVIGMIEEGGGTVVGDGVAEKANPGGAIMETGDGVGSEGIGWMNNIIRLAGEVRYEAECGALQTGQGEGVTGPVLNPVVCTVEDTLMLRQVENIEEAARETRVGPSAIDKGKAIMEEGEDSPLYKDSYGYYCDSSEEEDYDYDFWESLVLKDSYWESYYNEEVGESSNPEEQNQVVQADNGGTLEDVAGRALIPSTSIAEEGPASGGDQEVPVANLDTLNVLAGAALAAEEMADDGEAETEGDEQDEVRVGEVHLGDDDFVDEPVRRTVCLPQPLANLSSDIRRDEILPEIDAQPVFDADFVLTGPGNEVRYEEANDAMYIGRVFKDRDEMRTIFGIHAVKNLYDFKRVRSDPHRLILKCVDRNCRWRVFGHTMGGDSTNMEIRTATFTHTCDVITRSDYPKKATARVIAEVLKKKYANGKAGPRAVEVPELILAELNVGINYMKAWRGKEAALEMARGTEEAGYSLLRGYMHLLQQTNEGTVYKLKSVDGKNGGEKFKYLFFALGASIAGIPYLRKVVIIDGTAIKAKFRGCLMTASYQDGNYQIFPIGFGVVDGEDHAAWSWFFLQLSEVIPDSDDLVFVSDRHSAIYSALREVYPRAAHGVCAVHLYRNVKSKFKGKGLGFLTSKAAKAYSLGEFRRWFDEIHQRNPACADYLVEIGFEHWTQCFFPGMRYNLTSSNIAESLNSALSKALELPIVLMVEAIRMLLMQWFCWRRAKSAARESVLTEEVDNLILEHLGDSKHLAVAAASGWIFQVNRTDGCVFTVDLENKSCSCRLFDKLLIPCCHALVAARACNLAIPSLVSAYYTTETWRAIYSGVVMPVPNREDEVLPADVEEDMEPPAAKRGSGRPRKVRIPSQGEKTHKRVRLTPSRCSACLQTGHNRQTCKNPVG